MENYEHEIDEEKELCLFDPVRKSLALARYCKFLSYYHVQYSQEYLQMSKVGHYYYQSYSRKYRIKILKL